MTNEEIKNTPELVDFMLDKSVSADSRTKVRKRLEEVCNLAIKTVEQEPCKDAISRKAVHILIHELEEALVYEKNYISRERDSTTIIEDILALPPVTPPQKIGHWIDGDDKCPCCGKSKFEGLDADIWADWQPKHCPNCGAKMLPTGSDCNSCKYQNEVDGSNCYECVKGIRNNYKAENNIEKCKPCINYEDGCEEWAGCPCVYYYEDGYCENLKLQPCYPSKGCGDFSKREALEQESILDKIRAEIENDWQLKKYPSSPFACGLRRAIEIIDKYKAESEDKE